MDSHPVLFHITRLLRSESPDTLDDTVLDVRVVGDKTRIAFVGRGPDGVNQRLVYLALKILAPAEMNARKLAGFIPASCTPITQDCLPPQKRGKRRPRQYTLCRLPTACCIVWNCPFTWCHNVVHPSRVLATDARCAKCALKTTRQYDATRLFEVQWEPPGQLLAESNMDTESGPRTLNGGGWRAKGPPRPAPFGP